MNSTHFITFGRLLAAVAGAVVLLLISSGGTSVLRAQTQIDLRTQAKSVDFSAATRTKPFKTGTALPATCTVGEAYFRTDATAGQNLYGCTAANTWTLQSSGSAIVNTTGSNSYTATFSSLTMVTVPGATHHLASNSLIVVCYDLSSPARLVEPDSITVNSGTFDVAIHFAVPQSGSCILTGSSSGTGGTASSDMADAASGTLQVLRSTPTTLAIGSACSQTSPCNVRFGSTVYGFTTGATVTLNNSGGTGTAYLYATRTGSLAVAHNLTLSCAGCTATAGIPAFPPDSIPLAIWTASNGTWDANGGIDERAFLSSKFITSGPGVMVTDSGNAATVSVDTSLVPQMLTATALLSIPSLAPNSCSTDQTLSVPGALVGDAVAPGWPASLPTGLTGTMRVTAANTVAVNLCNVTSSAAAAISSATFRATILRSF